MRHPSVALLLAVAAFATPAPVRTFQSAAQPSAPVSGTWTLELRNGQAFLQVRTAPPPDWGGDRGGDWNVGQSISVDELSGIPANDERFTASSVKFELRREAGTLTFDGAFRDGRGAGLFTFLPRAAFDAEMKAIGYDGDFPVWRRFQLAVHDVGPKYIRALEAEGYGHPTLDQVQRARNHGVTADYIKTMKAEGYQVTTLDDIVHTRDHGVTAEFVHSMRAAGFRDASFPDLLRARDHGVTPDFVQELRGQGIDAPTLGGFIRLRDHGVRGPFVVELKKAGYDRLDADEIVRVRDHGVTADYIADMKGLGLKNLTLDDIVRLRDHGVTPGFVNHVRARGYVEDTADGLIHLKNRGLSQR